MVDCESQNVNFFQGITLIKKKLLKMKELFTNFLLSDFYQIIHTQRMPTRITILSFPNTF